MRRTMNPLFRNFPVNRLRQEMDRVVNEVFAPVAREFDVWTSGGAAGPRVNVWEENDTFFAEAEVPGLRQDDLDISVVGNQLTIKGRRGEPAEKTEGEQPKPMFHRRERPVGEFVRMLTLPAEVNAEAVTATLVGGVLTVSLPKAEAAKPRKIVVQG